MNVCVTHAWGGNAGQNEYRDETEKRRPEEVAKLDIVTRGIGHSW